jgi:hypothetical protein
MEILIFAFIASCKIHRPPERVITEPEEFQPFDLKALRHAARPIIAALSGGATGPGVGGLTGAWVGPGVPE